MTFKQLEQFLKTEKWQAGEGTDMCGKYARCTYCDHFADYPCARAYDTLVHKKQEGKASVAAWQLKEPDVMAKFGTEFAEEETDKGITRITLDPEDLYYFFLGNRSVGMYSHPHFAKEVGETETDAYPHTTYVALPSVPAGDEDEEDFDEYEEYDEYDEEETEDEEDDFDAFPPIRNVTSVLTVKKRGGEGIRLLSIKRRTQNAEV